MIKHVAIAKGFFKAVNTYLVVTGLITCFLSACHSQIHYEPPRSLKTIETYPLHQGKNYVHTDTDFQSLENPCDFREKSYSFTTTKENHT